MPEAVAAAPPRRHAWHRRAHKRFRHSVKARLVALFLLLAFGMTSAFLFGTQQALTVGWRDAARPLLADYVDRLVEEIGSPPSRDRAKALAQRLPVRVRITGPSLNWQSGDFIDEDEHRYWRRREDRGEPALLTRQTADGHRIEFGLDTRPWRDRPRLVGWATLAVLLVLTALAYVSVRRLLRPLEDIRDGARRFGEGRFDQQIPVRRRDELGQLADDINAMAGSLHAMLDAKRSLLLAISHELRSPLTRARLHAELLPEAGEAAVRRKALLRELEEMAALVSDLLESERLGAGHAALHLESVDLAQLAREVIASLATVEPAANAIVLETSQGLADLPLDPARMRLLLRNLLVNALRHGAGPQPPSLAIIRHAGAADLLSISVRDHGPGVAPETLAQLGQPFWRPDDARGRDTGGAGVGLYLCRLVAQAHGGRLLLRNREPGFEAEMLLPLAPPGAA